MKYGTMQLVLHKAKCEPHIFQNYKRLVYIK